MIPPPLAPPALLLLQAICAPWSTNNIAVFRLQMLAIGNVHVFFPPRAPIALRPAQRTHPVLKDIAPVLKEMAKMAPVLKEMAPVLKEVFRLQMLAIRNVHVIFPPRAPIALSPAKRTHPVLKDMAPVLKEMATVLKYLIPVLE